MERTFNIQSFQMQNQMHLIEHKKESTSDTHFKKCYTSDQRKKGKNLK